MTTYTREVMEKSLYIRSNPTFAILVTFSNESTVGGSENTFKVTSKSNYALHKLPDFDISRFNDETTEGHDFIKSIERTFKSHTLSYVL